jgi:hypothetical protein
MRPRRVTFAQMTERSGITDWMDGNLETQGFCLRAGERRELRVGVRFSTGLCLALVIAALALQSALAVGALALIGLVAGFSPRHPFDLLWNHALRHAFAAPELPPNPARRRHAFKLATVWLLAVAALLAGGLTTAGVALGGVLVAVCGLVTATNFCVPSLLLSLLERRRAQSAAPARS